MLQITTTEKVTLYDENGNEIDIAGLEARVAALEAASAPQTSDDSTPATAAPTDTSTSTDAAPVETPAETTTPSA